jgi:oligopeptide transport system substrate-binding protein
MAVDRQALIDNVLKGDQLPAGFFSAGTSRRSSEDHPEYAVLFDPEGAQAELQAYLDEKGITIADLPPITLMHNESEAHARIAQAIQQMWTETLGVEVQIATQEWAVFLTTIDEDAPQIYRLGWCLDYPDTSNFLFDVWHSSMDPRGNWGNAEFSMH